MARILTDGAEFGDTVIFSVPANVTASTTQKRSGAYSYSIGSNALAQIPLSNLSEFYMRVAVFIPTSASITIIKWRNTTTELGSVRTNATSGKFELYTGTGTLVGTGSVVYTINQWYVLELRVKIADAGNLELKVDGTSDIAFSGDTKPGSETNVDNVCITHNVLIYFDDIAINDTSGGVDDSWCGDGKIVLLTPNANGDLSQLTGSDGNSTDNYLLVDEFVNDGDTTYVEGSTVNEKDLYNLTPTTGLNVNTVRRVWAESRSRDTVADGGTVALTLKTESTEYDGSDVSLLTTYTKRILGTVHKVNPNTSTDWTTTQLDALQVGPKTRS